MIAFLLKKVVIFYKFFKIDTPLFILLILLSSFGLLILYSSSGGSLNLVYRQMVHLGLATSVMLVIAQIPPIVMLRFAPILMLLGIFLLILVIFFGSSGGGAQRWLDLGFVRFQPSELMKIIVPMTIAAILSEKTLPPRAFPVIISLITIVTVVLLIARQPDLGTSLLIGASGVYVLFFSGFRVMLVKNIWFNLVILSSALTGSLYFAWNYLLIAYQKRRILTLFNPESDPLGSGYHIIQSKIAIGSGGFTGKGIVRGSQSQLDFVPEQSTDFIFSVLAEELGFLGFILLILIYSLIIFRCMSLSLKCEDNFSRLLGASLTFVFFTYIFVNIAMVSGLLPVVGVPLPLFSYGGSSLITLMASFGIIMSIHKHKSPRYLQ
ncbi:rod shape-determining protein RodA [Candidatus Pseudothioglobus singularis]|nr:rod shape-determining protein RodA [Candidatus Pseudothioglobus singularis]MDA8855158.1 rod shape-determining protein RodA [Candidatus Pseudothioglobus singularis]MDC0596470.1 rod shape-determining protein RodA [Candidatus Pseudothioglobus singularis]